MDFEQIYRLYFRDVYLYLRSLSANEDLAQELTQEVFSKALKSIDRFDGHKDIRAWLFTIAKNTYFTYCKRKKLIAMEELDETVSDNRVHFTEQLENEEQAFLVHQFLHDMKEPYKEVFSLRVFGQLSFAQIGEVFGKTANWACVTYHRAKSKIQEAIR